MYLPRPTVYRLPIGGSCSELRGRMPAEGRYTALLKAKLGRRSGKVPRSLNSLAPAFHPRRLAARSLLDGSFSLGCVEFCRIPGDFIAEDGELVRHSCNTYATVMQHLCNTHATLMRHPQRRWVIRVSSTKQVAHVACGYGVGRWHGGSVVHIFWSVKRQQDKAGIIASTQRRSTCPSIQCLQESLRQ